MANNPTKWSAVGTEVVAIASTDLVGLATGINSVGAEIDNTLAGSSGGYQYADFKLRIRGSTAFHAGDYVALWMLRDVTDTEYEDGSTAITPARPSDAIFPLLAVATQQVTVSPMKALPPGKFKILLSNLANHSLTTAAGENQVSYVPYNDNLVSA
jgi:hypothetical protein